MKLRIKDNSLRFRLLRTEVATLAETGEITRHTLFGLDTPASRLSYSIEHSSLHGTITADMRGTAIRVSVPSELLRSWAKDDNLVGLYAKQVLCAEETLHIAIEKDFACIDRSDEDNADTFDNSKASVC